MIAESAAADRRMRPRRARENLADLLQGARNFQDAFREAITFDSAVTQFDYALFGDGGKEERKFNEPLHPAVAEWLAEISKEDKRLIEMDYDAQNPRVSTEEWVGALSDNNPPGAELLDRLRTTH